MRHWIACVFAVVLTACASVPVPEPEAWKASPMAFVWGCWIARDAPRPGATATLRLLPNPGDQPEYAGHVLIYGPGEPELAWVLGFAQEGSQMSLHRPTDRSNPARTRTADAPSSVPRLESGWRRAVFTGGPGPQWVIAEAAPEEIRLYSIGPEANRTEIFAGQRDGCD